MMDLKKAKENRKRFLAPYREKFIAEKEMKKLEAEKAAIELNKIEIGQLEAEKQRPEISKKQAAIKRKEKAIKKKRSEIISDLIAIEPSHLSEPWIIKEVIAWLRDRDCCVFLEDVFVKAPKKAVRTEDQRKRAVRDFYLINDIEKIMQDKNIGIRAACKVLYRRIVKSEDRYYLLWDTKPENENRGKGFRNWDAEVIFSAYKNAKKKPAILKENFNPPWPYYGRDVDENGIFAGR